MRPSLSVVVLSCLFASAGCGAPVPLDSPTGSGGSTTGSGGAISGSGGAISGSGGAISGSGGAISGSGGAISGSGGAGSGGVTTGTGGQAGVGGLFFPTGGTSSGGGFGTGGAVGASGGGPGSGGAPPGTGGAAPGSGGATPGSGGAGSGGAPPALDCDAAMPTSGGTVQNGNGQGGSGNLGWQLWSNQNSGSMTHYNVPAFSATWDEDGDFLARIGYEWGSFGQTPQPYEAYGDISVQFTYKRGTQPNGSPATAGGYSYVGVYGWFTGDQQHCVEYYIIDDSWSQMPFNPGQTTRVDNDDVVIDGSGYVVYTRQTPGTGGSRCSGSITQWMQYYSMRKTARSCGTISVTEHFDAWAALGLPMGNLLEAKMLLEVGGGKGTVTFPVANVIATNPDP